MGQGLLMVLREDHQRVKHLLDELSDTKPRDSDERQEKFDELYSGISVHMKFEEESFYPAVQKKRKSAKEDVDEGFEEHHVARQALDELKSMDKGEERWGTLLKVTKEMIEHHIAEEQAVVFEHADKGLSESELEKMGQQFEEMRSQKMSGS